MQLTNELFQPYEEDEIKVEILYNNSRNYFYFNKFENDELIQGDSKIVNGYEDDHIKFSSLKADVATYEEVTTFVLEFKNAEL